MKKTKDLKTTMIVLGAGASIGGKRYPIHSSALESVSKMPSSQHFFYDLFHQRETDWSSDRFVNILGLTYEGVNELLERAWGIKRDKGSFNPQEWRNINVEDVFTFLDVGEKMFNKGTDYYRAFSKSKEYLEDFIGLMLRHRCENQHCERLMNVFSWLKPHDNIISFNWNTIADITLARLKLPQYKNYRKIMSDEKIRIREYIRPGLFLKLHGSLSWIDCQNRKCRSFGKPQLPPIKRSEEVPSLISGAYNNCPFCKGEKVRLFIVPPVSEKLIHKNTFLHKLWLIAREKLAHTKRIVFIGYSFSPTDFYTEWLFRQIHFLEGTKPEIEVVNPEVFKRVSPVYRRYKNLFKDFKITRYRTLAEYANHVGPYS
jgi:hypothetical protein